MKKSNLKMILEAVRGLIMKNRVAYKDYLGEETVDEVICEGVCTGSQTPLTVKQSEMFQVGKTYQVVIDDTVSNWVAKAVNKEGSVYIGPWVDYFIEHGNDPSDMTGMWLIMSDSENLSVQYILEVQDSSFVDKTFVVSQSITRKKYDIKKLPEELLPDATVKKIHTHSNKDLLDELSWDDYNNWNNKSDFDGDYNALNNQPIRNENNEISSGRVLIKGSSKTLQSSAYDVHRNSLTVGKYYYVLLTVTYMQDIDEIFPFYVRLEDFGDSKGFDLGTTGLTPHKGYFENCKLRYTDSTGMILTCYARSAQIQNSYLNFTVYGEIIPRPTLISPQSLPFIGNNGLQYGIVRAKAKTDAQTLPVGADTDGCLWAQAPESVLTTEEQALTDEEKAQVIANIGAIRKPLYSEPDGYVLTYKSGELTWWRQECNWNEEDHLKPGYIENKPCYETSQYGLTINNASQKANSLLSSGGNFYRVSDIPLTIDKITELVYYDTFGNPTVMTSDTTNWTSNNGAAQFIGNGPVIVSKANAGPISDSVTDTFPEPGLYCPVGGGIEGIDGYIKHLQKLDKKFVDYSDCVLQSEFDDKVANYVYDGILLKSTTADSSKKFKITVDDAGTLTATEVTTA